MSRVKRLAKRCDTIVRLHTEWRKARRRLAFVGSIPARAWLDQRKGGPRTRTECGFAPSVGCEPVDPDVAETGACERAGGA